MVLAGLQNSVAGPLCAACFISASLALQKPLQAIKMNWRLHSSLVPGQFGACRQPENTPTTEAQTPDRRHLGRCEAAGVGTQGKSTRLLWERQPCSALRQVVEQHLAAQAVPDQQFRAAATELGAEQLRGQRVACLSQGRRKAVDLVLDIAQKTSTSHCSSSSSSSNSVTA